MMNLGKAAALALVMAMGTAGSAAADGDFSGNIALTSDYVYRGVTQTDGAPTIQGGLDYETDSFYVGTWASGVDFGDGTSTEIDFYGGWTPSFKMFSFDIGAIYYAYPDAPDEPEQNFLEVYAGVEAEFVDGWTVGASYAYSPEFYAETGAAGYTKLTSGYQFTDMVGADVSAGFQDFYDRGQGDSYSDYSIGLGVSIPDWVDLDFRAITTEGLDGNDDSFVVTISRSL